MSGSLSVEALQAELAATRLELCDTREALLSALTKLEEQQRQTCRKKRQRQEAEQDLVLTGIGPWSEQEAESLVVAWQRNGEQDDDAVWLRLD